MPYKITKKLTKVNKGKKGDNNPEWIVVHFVGASGQAEANAEYFEETYRGASAGYFVDPKKIMQVVEDDTPAWHIGDGYRTGKGAHNGYHKKGGATNTNSIGIEGCQDTSTGKDVWSWEFHPETVKRIEWLVRKLQKEHNIDDAHVIRHFDASGKNCPGNWSKNNWKGWKDFKAALEKDIKQAKPSAVIRPEGKPYDDDMYLVEAGDTLYSIAKEHKVEVEDLVKWNKLKNPDFIVPETKLFLKREEPIAKPVTPVATPSVAPKPAPTATKSIDQLAKETIDGKHGSGDARKKSLGKQYNAVQARVNEMLAPKKAAPKAKTVEQLADEVMKGMHGTGRERMVSLGNKYTLVQQLVNKRSR